MKNKSLILFMVGIIIILNGYELYSKFGYLFYPESYNYLASASTARLYTSLDDIIFILGALFIGISIYMFIKSRYSIPKLKHFYPILAIYTIILMVAGGMVHIMPSGYKYHHYLTFVYGLPMFTPNFLFYESHIIGIYIYPFQVLSLIGASILGSSIFAFSIMGLKLKKATPLSLVGAIGVCPACATGTFFGLVIGASPFLSSFYLNQIYGSTFNEIILSVISIALLLGIFLYMIRKNKITFKYFKN
ncbi:hypothetical protein FAD_1163 [Ferroplasma acidiphilum]|uniref:Uncharacterized protein n=2 Tax=Ferroplasma acidiphilum TaxID=74969 RepID=A0A1V0N4M3_9ARCH|nr:hypothetical protein [Ferroplasma acidiphilum]ARD85039.1 hypothetical protein FAD_1163 [Ferroplasma acidiphilum]